jgi:hypothetical protein
VIENLNGSVKSQIRYFHGPVQCVQFGSISKVVRIGFLMQNFKKAVIQNNNYATNGTANDKRPCRAAIRWYGRTDAGLRDVRGDVHLWGLKCEIELHNQLSAMDAHKDKSPIEISELVLAQRLDLRKRTELYRNVHGIEYNGDI